VLRSIALAATLAALIPITFVRPFVGVLLWTWLSLMGPQALAYGFAQDIRWGLIVGVVTIMAWLVSTERKAAVLSFTNLLILVFTAWISLTTYYALVPEAALIKWDSAVRVMVLAIVANAMMTNKIRIHAMIWIIALSIGYFGAKGGAFVLATGGNYVVFGTAAGNLADQNQLALALAMVLPLLNYLRLHSADPWVRRGLLIAMVLSVFAIVGTYSRGGLIGLAVVGSFMMVRSRAKVLTFVIVALAIALAVTFMPQQWWDRMATISEYEQDGSAVGRLTIWRVCLEIGLSRFVGGGFSANEFAAVVLQIDPSVTPRAAHSIYMEVFAEQGVTGFLIWAALMASAWFSAWRLARAARRRPELQWAGDLGRMLQASMAAYFAAGAFLSFGYWAGAYLFLATAVAARAVVARGAADQERAAIAARRPQIATAGPLLAARTAGR